jgi:hypothetical protein
VRKSVKNVKPAHLNVMPACDEDAKRTIRHAMNRRPTLDHNMVYVQGKNLKLHPFYRHELGVKRCERSQISPSQLDAGDDDPFIVLPETKFSIRYIPVWARYSPLWTRVEAHTITLSP